MIIENEISLRFREVLLSGKWIANTNYRDTLSHVNWEQAKEKIGSANSISILTQHINYYITGILNVFNGGTLDIKDKFSFDFPTIQSKKDWADILNELSINSERFAEHIGKMSNKQLDKPFVNEKYGNYRKNIEAMIEHSYYHLGQIVLLKKMIEEK